MCKGIKENLRYGSVTNHTSFLISVYTSSQQNILYIFKHLLIWLYRVLVVAHGEISVVAF